MKDIDLIKLLPEILENSRNKAEKIIEEEKTKFNIENIHPRKSPENSNLLYKSNNLYAMQDLLAKGYGSKIDLIYIDPPFFSMANYKHRIEVIHEGKKVAIETFAYSDTWNQGMREYLEMISTRLFLIKELLSDQGTIYLHLDFRMVHYVKIIMDCIFGGDNFLNEIIWSYKSGGTSKKYFSRKHDNILVYTKTKNYIFNPQKEKSYNRDFKPYRFKNVEEFQDQLGWYTLVNLKDVWQINMVGRTSSERIGYRTQKPIELLERIILSSSVEGSIVADFFGGSGTTALVAQKNNRRWISSDLGDISTGLMRNRLAREGKSSYKILNSIDFLDRKILDFELEKRPNNDSTIYAFKLKKFRADISGIKLGKNHTNLLKNIVKRDSLSLIDYIAVGRLVNKEEIDLYHEEIRSRDTLLIREEFEVDLASEDHLILRLVDVFGQEFIQRI